jgi:Fe-S cluster biogenesis protein NfuA
MIKCTQPASTARIVPTRRARIEAVLARIRPLLRADGADVELIDVHGNGASVRFTGLCGVCASAPLSLHTDLNELLREEIAGFDELRLE